MGPPEVPIVLSSRCFNAPRLGGLVRSLVIIGRALMALRLSKGISVQLA